MSGTAGGSEAAPTTGGDIDNHAAGSSSSEAPRSRAPVVAAMPLDPALVDLIAARVTAQLRGSLRRSADSVPGATDGERPGRRPAPSEDTDRGDSSERRNREAGGKEECSKRVVVEQRGHSLELRYIDAEKSLGLVVGGGPS